MNTEWLKLRAYNGSQADAFEELVCQLAEAEPFSDRIKFIRVAAPDAGKEAYCTLKLFRIMQKTSKEGRNLRCETQILAFHGSLGQSYD